MQHTFKILFTGTFKPGIPPEKVRERLLKVFKGKHEIVERFFTQQPLVIKKGLDYTSAVRYKDLFEYTGAVCRVIEDRGIRQGAQGKKTVPQQQAQTFPTASSRAEADRLNHGAILNDQGTQKKQPASDRATENTVNQPGAKQTAQLTGAKPLLKGSKLQNTLAAVLILLLVLSVGVRIWAISRERGIFPPDNISSNGSTVAIHYNSTIFFLTPEGQLLKRVGLAHLGLNRKPADIQLLRNGDLIIGSVDTGEIMRCEGSDLICRNIGPAGEYRINNNFKFLADEERNLIFIADTNNNELLFQDLEGSAISGVEAESHIHYPNDMTLDRNGRLWLSNTFHSTVLSFTFQGDRLAETDDKIKLRPKIPGLEQMEKKMENKPPEGLGDIKELLENVQEIAEEQKKLGDDLVHTSPLALSWDAKGNLWVIASNPTITTAGLRVFSPEGTQIMRIPFGKDSIPVDIDREGENMLVADSGLFHVLSVNTESGAVEEFGDDVFQNELAQVRGELNRYREIIKWAGKGIWLLALATIILVLLIVIRNHNARSRIVHDDRRRALQRAPLPARSLPASNGMQPAGIMKQYRIAFTGTGSEYFRIWIVNTFLTIVTLGIYAAWAKVRTRQYFYKNTRLDGHSFDYTADPMAIFKGYVIVGGGILIYNLSEAFNPVVGLIAFGLFALIIPFLIYKSIRFFARNSAYRNIRHRFMGTLGDSYRAYLFYPLLIPFTLGLIIPYWAFVRKKYFFNNLAFGTTNNTFRGDHGPFYKIYIIMGLATVGFVILSTIFMSFITAGIAVASSADSGAISGSVIFMLLSTYGMFLIVFTFTQQYLYAWELNYCLGHSELGGLTFESSLNGVKLFWIRISNIFAIVFSLGFLIPWAKVRRTRYIMDSISIIAGDDLNHFTSAIEPDESAYGDAATDFFDFDIGL
jgi:uncharacterized membrane protein YjgN (DUF898 family)